jgi:hypothetical protein
MLPIVSVRVRQTRCLRCGHGSECRAARQGVFGAESQANKLGDDRRELARYNRANLTAAQGSVESRQGGPALAPKYGR